MLKKTKLVYLGILIVLIITGGILIHHYLTHLKPITKFSQATPYTLSEAELTEFNRVEYRMSIDSTRYCDADFNGDSVLDRAYATISDTSVIFNIGTDKEKVNTRTQYGSSGFTCIAGSDINRDGKIDLVLGDPCDGRIDVLYNNGKGDFAFNAPFGRSDGIWIDPRGTVFIIKDINKDNLPDIIYKSDSNNYYALINQGNGR
jgi:hypothetical protein